MKRYKDILTIILLNLILVSCSTNLKQSEMQIKDEIQKQLDKCVKAVETKDIELYMDQIPDDFLIYDESGEIITREKQKEYTLRDWSIIDRTLSNHYVADSIKISGDSAIVFTSQRWERLMFQRDGKTKDTVLTTQKHVETWKKTKNGWLNYDVKELGGEIFINGKKYQN
jgi:PBP1b-binding outer membrane lipoprotein LpoB